MKILHFFKSLFTTFILLFLISFFHQKGFCQKNIVKVTPLKISIGKVNVSYERMLNNTWSVIADAQRWSYRDKEVDKKTLLGIGSGLRERVPVLEDNKGTRFSFEIRGYSFLKEKKGVKSKAYFGAAGFVGKHSISMKRQAHNILIGGISQPFSGFTSPKLNGDIDLISGGAYFNFGLQYSFKNRVSVEIGGMIGRAWINQENDYLILYDQTPYNLEPEKNTYHKEYAHGISGLFFQPMLNVGYRF